jgi:glycosyltransferase involved in cell wall biosynthesis
MTGALKIAFVGSRGIPAKYGGAETFAEEISQKLIKLGFEVYVTCNSHRFHKDVYNGVIRIHTPSIQGKTLTVPTINEILSAFHLLLRCPTINLVYYATSYAVLAAVIPRLLGKKVIINTDGIEWKRLAIRRQYFSPGWKFISVLASWYLKLMERLAVKLSNAVIADSREIKAYLEESYNAKNVVYIPYGARELHNSDIRAEREQEVLKSFALSSGEYYLTVGRIVAENNIHKEIEGFKGAKSDKKFAIVGNFNNKDKYTGYLIKLRDNNPRIMFLNPIYDKEVLGILRKNCYAYIHAYEVGGTSPSLVEQMLFRKPILEYDVPFNREVLQDGGVYFRLEDELAECIKKLEAGEFDVQKMGEWQSKRIKEEYNWDSVAEKYKSLFMELLAVAPDEKI